MTAEFDAYDPAYTGGVSLSTGWVAGAEGGAQSVITGQLTGPGEVRGGPPVRAWTVARRCTCTAPNITPR